jgi:hypothetical protein
MDIPAAGGDVVVGVVLPHREFAPFGHLRLQRMMFCQGSYIFRRKLSNDLFWF